MVFSVRFLLVHDGSGPGFGSYVVPAGHVAIVRDADAYNGLIVSNDVLLTIFDGATTAVFWQDSWAVNDPGWRNWRGRQVLQPGDTLFADAGGNPIDLVVSGYLLTA